MDVRLQLTGGPKAAARAREAVASLQPHLPPEQLDDVRLLVSELVTNSIRHAGVHARQRVGMRLQADGNMVRIEVSDRGPGFTPRPRPVDTTRPGGWGLVLVDRIADRWGVDVGDRTRVWFEIDGPRTTSITRDPARKVKAPKPKPRSDRLHAATGNG